MKRRLLIFAAVVMTFTSLAGCSQIDEISSEINVGSNKEEVREYKTIQVEEGDIVIGVAHKSSSSPFWISFEEGVKAAGDIFGVKIDMLGPAEENDPIEQAEIVEYFIEQNYDGIVLAPCDDVGLSPVVQTALSSGISVVTADNGVVGVEIPLIATDNRAAAALAAEYIGDALEGKGNILMINGIITQGSGQGRYEGFKTYIEENYPEMNILEPINAEWDSQKAIEGVQSAVDSGQKIDAVFAAWDGGALQAHSVFKEMDKLDEVVIVGFDLYEVTKTRIKDGEIEADVVQAPYNMGFLAVKTAVEEVNGVDHDLFIDTGAALVTKYNITDYE